MRLLAACCILTLTAPGSGAETTSIPKVAVIPLAVQHMAPESGKLLNEL